MNTHTHTTTRTNVPSNASTAPAPAPVYRTFGAWFTALLLDNYRTVVTLAYAVSAAGALTLAGLLGAGLLTGAWRTAATVLLIVILAALACDIGISLYLRRRRLRKHARAVASALLLLIVGALASCGGGNLAAPAPVTVTAAENKYFTTAMIGQTWKFVNGHGDQTTISIEAGPVVINGIAIPGPVMHFTKRSARAWWQPGTEKAELWFTVAPQKTSDGGTTWASSGSRMDFPLGCWFCAGFTHAEQTVTASPGAYMVMPSGPVSIRTSYTSHWTRNDGADFITTVAWRTDAVEGTLDTPIYHGPGLLVKVREGCERGDDAPSGCYWEEYDLAPGLGWVGVVPYNQGRGLVDPLLAMKRVE